MNSAQLLASLNTEPTAIPPIEAIYATGHWLLTQDRISDAAKIFRFMMKVAPSDERGWLALGECHERLEQWHVALELYGAGSVVACPSVRCLIARSRTLRVLERESEADDSLEAAVDAALESDDDALHVLAAQEKNARETGARS